MSVAGIMDEGFSDGQFDEPLARQAAGLCRDAGADPEAIAAWAEEGRRRRAVANMPPISCGLHGGGRQSFHTLENLHSQEQIAGVTLEVIQARTWSSCRGPGQDVNGSPGRLRSSGSLRHVCAAAMASAAPLGRLTAEASARMACTWASSTRPLVRSGNVSLMGAAIKATAASAGRSRTHRPGIVYALGF
jgi:hypothetical protein